MPRPEPVFLVPLAENSRQADACLSRVRERDPDCVFRPARAEALPPGPAVFLDCRCDVLPGWLPPLVQALDRDAEAAAPLCLDRDGNVASAGLAFDPQHRPRPLYAGFPADHPAPSRPRLVQAACGVLALSASLVKSLGDGPLGSGGELVLSRKLREADTSIALIPASRILAPPEPAPLFPAPEPAEAFAPDLHEHALADGLAVALNEWLHMAVRLDLDLETRLDSEHLDQSDPEALARLLGEHPLWEGGLLRLAEVHENAGRPGPAAASALKAATLFPGLGNFRRLMGLATRNNDHALAGRAANALSLAMEILADPAPLKDQAQARTGHPALAPLYTHWLTNLVDIF